MYEITYGKKFKSSYKKVRKSGRFDLEEFGKIIELFKKGEELPRKYYDHVLKGNLQQKRECHLSGDLLLTYEVHLNYKVITLSDIGNHAQIFGS